jgi:hypothetical protein
MEKDLFVKCIDAIQKQDKHDIKTAKKLAEAFPDAFYPNLLPKNHYVSNALIEVLQVAMNDGVKGKSWIEYYLWELDFGQENYRLKVTQDGKEVPLSTPGQLWDYLNKQKNKRSNL